MEHARKLPLSLHNTLTARKEQQQRRAQACKQALRHACAVACTGKPACHACRARERACTCTKHACGRTSSNIQADTQAYMQARAAAACQQNRVHAACCMWHGDWQSCLPGPQRAEVGSHVYSTALCSMLSCALYDSEPCERSRAVHKARKGRALTQAAARAAGP